MFSFFKKTQPNIADALTNQTIGGQSVLYKLFREILGCSNNEIRRLELTYLAATITTYVYLRFGQQQNREDILDDYTEKLLTKSIPSCGESISFRQAVEEYQCRYSEYGNLLPLLFNPAESPSGNPAVSLLMHAFECVTNSSPRENMIFIVAGSSFIKDYALDEIDFVRKKL